MFVERGAVHAHERLAGSGAVEVDRRGHQLLARARFAAEQDGGHGARDRLDAHLHLQGGVRGPDQFPLECLAVDEGSQPFVFALECLSGQLDLPPRLHVVGDQAGDDLKKTLELVKVAGVADAGIVGREHAHGRGCQPDWHADERERFPPFGRAVENARLEFGRIGDARNHRSLSGGQHFADHAFPAAVDRRELGLLVGPQHGADDEALLFAVDQQNGAADEAEVDLQNAQNALEQLVLPREANHGLADFAEDGLFNGPVAVFRFAVARHNESSAKEYATPMPCVAKRKRSGFAGSRRRFRGESLRRAAAARHFCRAVCARMSAPASVNVRRVV